MAPDDRPPAYRIYLLTVWQEHGQSEMWDRGWRFHLTDPQTGKRYGFTNAEALLAALRRAPENQPPVDEA